MKRLIRGLLPLLLLILLLTGCMTANEGESTLPIGTEAPVTERLLPPETTAPPTTAAVPVNLDGVEMTLSEGLTATPGSPCVELVIRFPAAELPGTDRSASLTLEQDGETVAEWPDLSLETGLELRETLEFSFERYQEDRTACLTATLRRGDSVLVRETAVSVDNYDEELYQLMLADSFPYSIHIIRNQNVVVIFGRDDDEAYTVPLHAWLCSTGRATPTGQYLLGSKREWGALFGGVYGQYVSTIYNNILFHSVPYLRREKDSLKSWEYNKLGTACSMGCVRLPVEGAKWIYENCPSGTIVNIYDADELPVERPTSIILDTDDPRSGWDPTDPDPANPWKKES